MTGSPRPSAREVRALRPAKAVVEAFRPFGWVLEEERTAAGAREPAVTVFLAGSECPFSCVYCDLWRYTLDGATPPGALPAQLAQALARVARDLPPEAWPRARLKLYNASNFFEERAVPRADEEALIRLARPFRRLVVECHPRLVGERCLDFAGRLAAAGSRLEVAMGLETVHPEALPRLGKGMTLEDFDGAARRLKGAGIPFRAFLLLGAPYVPPEEAVEWTVRSAQHAFGQGAEGVSVIPLRDGNGTIEALVEAGEATLPDLDQLEDALDRCSHLGAGVAVADLWDLERISPCEDCRSQRRERLRRQNLSGLVEPRVRCGACAPRREILGRGAPPGAAAGSGPGDPRRGEIEP